jgi:hypothetical protein
MGGPMPKVVEGQPNKGIDQVPLHQDMPIARRQPLGEAVVMTTRAPLPHRRASTIRLKGVSVARRNRDNPTAPRRPGPATRSRPIVVPNCGPFATWEIPWRLRLAVTMGADRQLSERISHFPGQIPCALKERSEARLPNLSSHAGADLTDPLPCAVVGKGSN